ncbi:hypothetical protein FISHEDRAFT_52130 [Fistulina hepatica ATCC 64428]|nr:hypothetical protein FISHEDRAFT_52130 [Fistulina hepatica ATCC 64428]
MNSGARDDDAPVEKDVSAELLQGRPPRRRAPGQIIYPLKYNRELVDLDVWQNMFYTRLRGGFSLYDFAIPPQSVLDLGCGCGYWIFEAAKRWKNTRFVGFDMNDMQPKLTGEHMRHHQDLASRIEWVHGDFLEPLPFLDESFDYVRIMDIGLGVPEDEEVSRVMKPGAVIEVVEGNLIFPCGPAPRLSSPPSSAATEPPPQLSFDLWAFNFGDSPIVKSLTSYDPSTESPTLQRPTTIALSVSSPTMQTSPQPRIDTMTLSTHPQDHSRLCNAWDSMLASRFLCPQLVTVLPFYLSSFFEDVHCNEPFVIRMPPNSNAPRRDESAVHEVPAQLLMHTLLQSSGHNASTPPRQPFSVAFERLSVLNWRSMHLAKTVRTIMACKEAIWVEYEKLYKKDFPPVARMSHPRNISSITIQSMTRDAFDSDWNNWTK